MTALAALVLVPLAAALVAFALQRWARHIALAVALSMPPLVWDLAMAVRAGGPLRMDLGGWAPPLGIGLYADGLSVLMVALTAVVGLGVSLYALAYYGQGGHAAGRAGWWPLWLLLWAGLNALFLSADAFNLYVTLELLGLAAVALVALEASAVAAALRYLMIGLLGSLLYLLGAGLLYAEHATLDLVGIAARVSPGPAGGMALALMTAGLMLKAALFPFHFWLAPAHAGAPAPASAVLSALVVKAAFYGTLRLWFGPLEGLTTPLAADLLGALGAGAVLWGSLKALIAPRLKLVVAWSTVAQAGYLFLVFPLARTPEAAALAWHGGVWLALAHGLAKASLFLAAGTLIQASGTDRVDELSGISRRLPLTLFTMGLAFMSLAGLPPSGGFLGKWLLLNAVFLQGAWIWALVLLAGGLLTAAYAFRVLTHAFRRVDEPHPRVHTPALMEWTALGLAVGAILLGLLSAAPMALLGVGAPAGPLGAEAAHP